MPRIDDYQSKLLDEIAALKHQLKACEKHLEVVRNQAEEWKQKAEQYDALGGKDYVLMHKDEVKELKEKANGLYKCSECPQWEKAEKWDAQQGLLSDTLTDIRKDLDLIFQGLEVKEKCQCDKGYLWDNPNYFGQKRICHFCHGTGFITRPPTAGEVRELIDRIYNGEGCWRQWNNEDKFKLKSGAILRMKRVK